MQHHQKEVRLEFVDKKEPDEIGSAEGKAAEVVDVEVLGLPVVEAVGVASLPHLVDVAAAAEFLGEVVQLTQIVITENCHETEEYQFVDICGLLLQIDFP